MRMANSVLHWEMMVGSSSAGRCVVWRVEEDAVLAALLARAQTRGSSEARAAVGGGVVRLAHEQHRARPVAHSPKSNAMWHSTDTTASVTSVGTRPAA
jgi:hypothetical protein